MAVRKDGVASSKKIFKAASEVFAEKGYRTATVAEICKRAKSNVAAINYYFKSKDGLYAAVWKNAFEQAMQVYPADGGLSPDASAEERLHALVHSFLHRILDSGRLGCSGQILLREIAEPTDVLDQILDDAFRPLQKRTQQIISELLGPKASDRELRFCELSVVHQCVAIGFGKSRNKLPPFLRNEQLTHEFIDEMAEHITFFSLAGIRAVREQAELKQKTSKKPRG